MHIGYVRVFQRQAHYKFPREILLAKIWLARRRIGKLWYTCVRAYTKNRISRHFRQYSNMLSVNRIKTGAPNIWMLRDELNITCGIMRMRSIAYTVVFLSEQMAMPFFSDVYRRTRTIDAERRKICILKASRFLIRLSRISGIIVDSVRLHFSWCEERECAGEAGNAIHF